MKNFIFAALMTLLCLCNSCNDRTSEASDLKDNPEALRNLEAWHKVSMAFVSGNANAIDSVIADDYVDHKANGDVKGRNSVKASIASVKANFKDTKMEIIKELADKDYGFFWMHFSGTSNGATGMPAGPFDMTSIQVVKFKDGKAIEHWEFLEMKELVKMMQQRGIGKGDSGMIKNK